MRVNYRNPAASAKPSPAKKKKGARKQRLGKAMKSLGDGNLNAPPDTFGQEHDQAVAIGRQIQQSAQAS